MDDPIQRLIRELRNEPCPRSVLDNVNRHITRNDRRSLPRRGAWIAILVGALGVMVLAVTLIRQNTPSREVPALQTTQATPDSAKVIEDTQVALALIGQILLEARSHAGNRLVDDAVPPLIKSYYTAKSKITESL